MLFIATSTLFLSSALVSAAPHVMPRMVMDTSLTRMDDAEVLSYAIKKADCWTQSKLVWPVNNTPPPSADKPIRQLSLFPRPESTANTLTVHNYCSYDIYFEHLNGKATPEVGVLKANSKIDRPLTGTVLKASKTKDRAKVVLIEYNVTPANDLWYNLSLVKCLGEKNGLYTTDTTGCAGHEGGLQFGNDGFKSYQCGAGVWCDDQAYLYDENMCKNQNPVSVCKPDLGLTMEFCAGSRA